MPRSTARPPPRNFKNSSGCWRQIPAARAEYDALRRLFDALQALPHLDPPPGLAEAAAEAANFGSPGVYLVPPADKERLPHPPPPERGECR